MPDDEKIDTILKMESPKNVKELERFLGMVTYVSKFINNATELTAPLRKLIKKDSNFEWTKTEENCYQILKSKLIESPTLQCNDPGKECTLSV